MSGFKRNSSRFSGNSGGGSNGGNNRNESREASDSGQNRRSGGSKGSNPKFKFTRLGSITVPKSSDDEIHDMIHNELKGSDVRLKLTIYPPKGVESVTLNRNDIIVITFKPGDKDPEFVVGNASLPNND